MRLGKSREIIRFLRFFRHKIRTRWHKTMNNTNNLQAKAAHLQKHRYSLQTKSHQLGLATLQSLMLVFCVFLLVLCNTSSGLLHNGVRVAIERVRTCLINTLSPATTLSCSSVDSISTSGTGTILLSNKACRTKIGTFDVIAEECEVSPLNSEDIVPTESTVIRLIDVGSGWGNGAHPSTKLCMNFVIKTIKRGDNFLDYGTGSGILSIAAAKLGAKHCVAVDIDEDTLIAAEMNGRINGVSEILDVVHTRSVYVGEDRFPISEVTVANILPVSLTPKNVHILLIFCLCLVIIINLSERIMQISRI